MNFCYKTQALLGPVMDLTKEKTQEGTGEDFTVGLSHSPVGGKACYVTQFSILTSKTIVLQNGHAQGLAVCHVFLHLRGVPGTDYWKLLLLLLLNAKAAGSLPPGCRIVGAKRNPNAAAACKGPGPSSPGVPLAWDPRMTEPPRLPSVKSFQLQYR